MAHTASKELEVVYVDTAEVACDGGNPVVGHPLVYLHLDHETGDVMCPYCSRVFRYRSAVAGGR